MKFVWKRVNKQNVGQNIRCIFSRPMLVATIILQPNNTFNATKTLKNSLNAQRSNSHSQLPTSNMAGLNTMVRELVNEFDVMGIIRAIANVEHPIKGKTDKTNKQDKKNKKNKKKKKEEEKKALLGEVDEQFPEWQLGDANRISNAQLRKAIASACKPRPKPLSAYMRFLQDQRLLLKKQGLNGRDTTKEAGRLWRQLDDEKKKEYKQLAIREVEEKFGPAEVSDTETVEKQAKKASKKKTPKASKKKKKTPKASKKKKTSKKKKKTPKAAATPADVDMFDSDSDSSSEEE